ncbi:FkbM family methyltransferase [Bacillus thuringiensis]|uniref:FkbM family methyltransferase n=1 Tax=Bacillus thuringiensis TaxID=1428 RepID=UPI0018CD4630|nr:FkbM family methyltransferase [Bacillus thuringiensis]MBG9514787.1 FkbM family methyltransferase [Bacillus thuringiensis]
MQGVYIGDNKILTYMEWNANLIVPSNDLSLTPSLVTNGHIELGLTNFFRKNLKPGNTVVDIGANIGYFSVLIGILIGPKGKLIAYESNPYIYAFLMDNLSINYLHDRSSVYQCAVYSSSKFLQFYASKRFMGNSSLIQHSKTYHKHYIDEIEKVQVKAITLDTHLQNITEIDFLKIDIEGGEYHAFLGMKELIQNKKIKTIIFELNPGMLQEQYTPFIKLLSNLESQNENTFPLLSKDGTKVPTSVEALTSLNGYPYVVMDLRTS